MPGFCRDCLSGCTAGATMCANCGSARLLIHPEVHSLHIAHLDCDAFYAAIEKRDNPSLAEEAVIVAGSSARAVVLTACYNARKYGVRSAMPMFQARKLAPNAVIVPPNMSKYAAVAKQVREVLLTATPIVEPVSLDEAYLDLSGTERLHGAIPAQTMARLANEIAQTIRISVSIGLSYNKFLAKLASDLDKPCGFAVIGRAEAKSFLANTPVAAIRGVGPALQRVLTRDGITTIGDVQRTSVPVLARRYGDTGIRLHRAANGEDPGKVEHQRETRGISAETTFEGDLSSSDELERELWDQCERLSGRAKAASIGGRTVTLKLKTAAFKIRTRSTTLENPTQLAGALFEAGKRMLKREANGERYRLLGIGLSHLCPAEECDPGGGLDTRGVRRAAAERAMDRVRGRFGQLSIRKGRSFYPRESD